MQSEKAQPKSEIEQVERKSGKSAFGNRTTEKRVLELAHIFSTWRLDHRTLLGRNNFAASDRHRIQKMAAQTESNSAHSAGRGNTATPANQLANIAKLLGSHVTFTVGDKQTRTLSGKLWAYDPSLGVVGLECEAKPLPPHLSSAPASAASVAQASQTSRNRFAQPTATVGFTIVKVSEIKKIEFHQSTDASNGTAPKSQADSLTPIHPVSLKTAQLREADAVKQSLTKVARTGKDVSQLGQQIFDALSKT